MSCYHPLKAFPIGLTENNKTKYKICSYECNHVYQYNDSWYASSINSVSPIERNIVRDFVEIPCGKCIGCRLEHSRQWANRCLLELEYHDSAYFVTLTYNDDMIPRRYYGDPETGDPLPCFTLYKRDFQLFMKRLRKAFPDDKIRFFACGEYGPQTHRPHFHAILFGLHLDDLVESKQFAKKGNYKYYESEKFNRCWSVKYNSPNICPSGETIFRMADTGEDTAPLGYTLITEVTWETCAYTARYVMKKLNGDEAQFYSDFNIDPPFSLMSRKPGIARQWYDDHPNLNDYEYINISTPTGGRKFRPPKYYNRLFDIDEPELSAELKETRKRIAETQKKLKLSRTDLSYLELLQVEEDNKNAQIQMLKRGDI